MEREMEAWLTERWAKKAVDNFKKNLFKAYYAKNTKEALSLLQDMLTEGSSICLGDSLTLHEMGAMEMLEKGGYDFADPWRSGITREESLALRRRAFTADIFLTGTNAFTLDGKLVSIDGLGNRVAAMIFGPKKVIVVAGINKMTGNVEEAILRVKSIAAPANARRHKFPPEFRSPCGETGFCSECAPPRRLCCNTVIIEGCSRDKERIAVIIVGETLGY